MPVSIGTKSAPSVSRSAGVLTKRPTIPHITHAPKKTRLKKSRLEKKPRLKKTPPEKISPEKFRLENFA